METVLISMTRADLSRLIVEAVSETLRVQAPDLSPMNLEEAATFVDRSPSTLYKMTSEGRIPHRKVGKKLYFDRAELTKWISEHRVRTAEELESEAVTRLTI